MTSQLRERVEALVALRSTPELDPNTVTPGVLGFVVTFLVAAAVVLLAIDMTRRIRRTRYRSEIAERLDAEQLGAQIDADAGSTPYSNEDPHPDGTGDGRRSPD